MRNSLTRRAALAGAIPAAAAMTLPAMASPAALSDASHPDAELLRLGAEFDRLHSIWLPLKAETERLEGVFDAKVKATEATERRNLSTERWFAIRRETGYEPAISREWAEALTPLCGLTDQMTAMPPQTIAGLAVRARALAFSTHYSHRLDGEDREDWDVECFARFLQEIERLAAAARA